MTGWPMRAFGVSLAASVLLHLALLATDGLNRPAWQKTHATPLTVTMQSFALDAPAAPAEQSPSAKLPPPSPVVDVPPAVPAQPPVLHAPPSAETAAATKMDDAVTAVAEADQEQRVSDAAQIASEPLHLPDENLDAVTSEAGKIFTQKTDTPRSRYMQDLNVTAALPQPEGAPLRVKQAYEVIAPPADARPPFPKDAQLRYEGPLGITGIMNFHRDRNSYRIETTFNIPFNKMQFVSEGKVANNQLIPLTYSDTRKGKLYASAVFDYDQQTVHFGKGATPEQSAPLVGVQHDFFSWAWQMSIDGGYMPGQIRLTNGKKIYAQESPPAGAIEMEESLYDTGEGKIRIVTQKIDRDSQGRHDTIAYGFAPDFANVPALIVFNNDGTEYQMHIIGIELDGHNYWQAVRRVNQGGGR